MERMPIADEIAAAAVLNELVCRERTGSRNPNGK
jgi:hypothetical protein